MLTALQSKNRVNKTIKVGRKKTLLVGNDAKAYLTDHGVRIVSEENDCLIVGFLKPVRFDRQMPTNWYKITIPGMEEYYLEEVG